MKYRIYIESDILHEEEYRAAQGKAANIIEEAGADFIKEVFNEALDFAWHDLEKTWRAVKKADEIYANTSLMPLVGNSYMGAPVIFNGMMERAIKENVKGKSVFIMRSIKDVQWDMIEVKLMKKAFKHNDLYMYDENRNMVKVDISKIKKAR